MPTTLVLQKRTHHGIALAHDPESAIGSLDEENIPPVERPQKRQRRMLSDGATHPSVEIASNHTTENQTGCCHKSKASSSNDTGLLVDARWDGLPVGCAIEAPFESKVLLN